MQIEGMQKNQTILPKLDIKEDKKDEIKDTSFDELLKTAEEKTGKDNGTMDQMIKNIDQLKKVLDYEMTVDNVAKYKEAVGSFLKYYTQNELKMEEHVMQDRRGYQKKVSIIRSIDEKLNDLNQNMLESPLGHMNILKKIGEIKGLVVNLLL